MRDIRNITNIALLTAMALAISLFEHMIPLPVPIPGAKLGFSNMIILITLYTVSYTHLTLPTILLV